MNKKYDVVWSNIAENDLKNIVEYIADDSRNFSINYGRNEKSAGQKEFNVL